jgi:hypothetical protein
MRKLFANPLSFPILSSLIALLPVTGSALDLTYVPRIQVGVMDYEFQKHPVDYPSRVLNEGEESASPSSESGYKLTGAMPLVSAGVTTFLNSFFIDVYLQKAFSGSDSADNTLFYGRGSNANEKVDAYFDREEYSISAGYGLGDHWTVFGGYRRSTTNFSTFEEAKLVGSVSEHIEWTIGDIDFVQDGYFFGATYAFPTIAQSVILFNTAFAFLDGDFDSFNRFNSSAVYPDGHENVGSPAGSYQSQFEGDSVGLNVGIIWKGRIKNSLAYSFGLNGYNYDFDGVSRERKRSSIDKEEEEFITIDRTLSETVLRFSAGLSYEF